MPVTDQTPIIAHTANGVSTAFAFPFLLDQSSDLIVMVGDALKTLATDYTVGGTGNPAGGTVTFTSAPANGVRVVFTRRTALQRLTDYQTGGANRANVLDADLDRLWLALQDGWLGVQKAVRYQNGDSGPTRMPVLADGQVLGQLGGALVGRDLASADSMNFIQSGAGAVTRSMQDKAREWVSIDDFGADRLGVTDSTPALVAALATGRDVLIPDATYKISPAAAQSIPNRGPQRIFGEGGATLLVDLSTSMDLFTFQGPVSLENLVIDFNNGPARYPFRWSDNCGLVRLNKLTVKNLRDTDPTTGSITFSISPSGNTFAINGITASSMLKRGNGVITDAAGSFNLIYIGGGSGSTAGAISDIFVREIHNIDASGNVIYEDTAAIYIATDQTDSSNCILIENVHGLNFGKRLLKIHASNVTAKNIYGNSSTGDSLGVVTFISDGVLGVKYGCGLSDAWAIGLMEYAFSTASPGVRMSKIYASTQPGNKSGMSNASVGVAVQADDVVVDGVTSDSQRAIGIGSTSSAVKNLRIKSANVTINATSTPSSGIYNTFGTLGIDGLEISDSVFNVKSDAASGAPVNLADYVNGTTVKVRNVNISGCVVQTAGPLNSAGFLLKFAENVSISSVKYINTSGLSHFRIIELISCSNVNIDDVDIEGVNQVGVMLSTCTGRSTVGMVYNQSASIAAVYNNNSSEVWVYGCDHAKVSGTGTPTTQGVKYAAGTTAARPSVGLVAGFSQYFDTTLGKPIWWNGSAWKDSTGATV